MSRSAPKVILFCPARETREIFAHALDAHTQLEGVEQPWYFDDCDAPTVPRRFRVNAWPEFANLPARSEYQNHNWSAPVVSRVTAIKDAAIEAFLKTDADALLLIDADMIPHPAMVAHLLSLGLPIVSEICWSKWKENEPWMPNAWDFHGYGFCDVSRITRLREPGVYDVGGLGGCTLIRREALQAGVRFARVQGLSDWGEDRHLCTRAWVLGFPLHVDTSFPLFHVYRADQLDEMARWRETGSDPAYFREVWLTDEWVAAVEQGMTPQKPRVIACCFPGESFASIVKCFWSDLQAHLTRRGFHVVAFYAQASNPHIVRETLRQQVLESSIPVDLVLWLDDDQLLSAPQFDKLLSDLDALPDLSIVAGWTWCDTGDAPQISAGRMAEDAVKCLLVQTVLEADGLIEVEWTGFPAVLMNADVLRHAAPLPFAPIPALHSQWGFTGEDVAFCANAKAQGCSKIFIDPKVFLPHLKLKALGLDGSPKSIQQACVEASAMLAGKVEVRFLEKEPA